MAKKKSATKHRGSKATVRTRILALLGREEKVYNRKKREYERRPPTMGELAKELKISIRQLRRWKNEGAEPNTKTQAGKNRVKRLISKSAGAARSTARELERDKERHPKAIRITKKDLPVLPAGHRRMLTKYARDRRTNRIVPTEEKYESPWINYSVSGWNFREIAAFIIQVWKAKHAFQFIYEVPAGGSLPKSGDKPARKVRKTVRAGTSPINPYAFRSEEELLDFLSRYIEFEAGPLSRRMVYIAVDDNRPDPDEFSEDED